MKRIVFFIGEMSEGGAERVISILSNELVKKDYDITILKYFDSELFYELDNKVKLVTVEENTNSTNIIKNAFWIRKYVKNNSDIVISFLAKFNMLAIVAISFLNCKLIVCDRNDPRHTPTNSLLRILRNFLYKFADRVVLQTEHNKDYFSKIVNSKSVVIANPLNMEENIGKAIQTPKEDLIVTAGRLMEQKNQIMLFKAFGEFKKTHPTYKLKVFGEGPYRETLQEYIDSNNMTDCISLVGQVKEIDKELSKARLFVLSSNYEGMPNVLIEAMCLGLPCISTKVSGATELIDNGENGILINLNDLSELIYKMCELIDNSEYSEKLAKEATKIYELLNVEAIANKWIDLINSL